MRTNGISTTVSTPPLTVGDEEENLMMLLDKLRVLMINGKDKRGRKILRIIGKCFPAKIVKEEVLRKYLDERIFPELLLADGVGVPFCVVYVHTEVQRSENFPGVSVLRSIYESLPISIKESLESVYFIHPGLQSRLFLATFGRFLFSSGLYKKVKYINRLEFLWEHVKKREVEIPEFVFDHDEELERRPLMDYGIESNHQQRAYDAVAMESSSSSMYSLRCIS